MDKVSRLILYGNRESGHSYKVKLALSLLGLPHQYRNVDLSVERSARPQDFRDISRYGEVPVLLVDNRPIVQSNAILLHLAQTTGRLQGDKGMDRLVEWLFWEANRIGFAFANLRFARGFKKETDQAVVAWLEARVYADLDRLDDELRDKRSFLLGDSISIADLSCCGYLFWPEQAGIDLARWPYLSAWLDRIKAQPGWAHPYDLMS